MSQENVEIVRSLYEAFNSEDWDAVLEPAASDFVLDMSRSIGPQQRGMYKRDQLRSFLEELGGPSSRSESTQTSSSRRASRSWCPKPRTHGGAMGSRPRPAPRSCTRFVMAP